MRNCKTFNDFLEQLLKKKAFSISLCLNGPGTLSCQGSSEVFIEDENDYDLFMGFLIDAKNKGLITCTNRVCLQAISDYFEENYDRKKESIHKWSNTIVSWLALGVSVLALVVALLK